MPKRTPKGTTRSSMFLDSVSEQEYHRGDSWASIEVVRVARVRAERSRWAEDKGEYSRETKPGTDGASGTGTDMPGQPSSASRVHSHATGPGTQQALSPRPSWVYTQAATHTLRRAGPTAARPQLAANLPSTWKSASYWKAFGYQEQKTP